MEPSEQLINRFSALSLHDSAPEPVSKVIKVHADDVHALLPLNDGLFASGSKDTTIRIWDEQLKLIKELTPSTNHSYKNWITALCSLSDGRWVSGSRSGTIHFWSSKHELLGQKCYKPSSADHKCKERNLYRINCFAELPSESQNLFLAGLPTEIQSWNFSSTWCLDTTSVSKNDWLYCIKPLGQHRFACVIGSDLEIWKNVQVTNTKWGFQKEATLLKEDPNEVTPKQRPHISACEFMNDNQFIMSLFSGAIKLFDIEKATVVKSYKEHTGRAWTVCPLSENLVASGADDGLLLLWDLRQAKSVSSRGPHSGRVSVTLKRSDETVLAASCPGNPFTSDEKASFTLWDIRS